jgi:predicted transposase/invertase (TIGR01784 family)
MVHFKRCEQSDIESALFIGKQEGHEKGLAEGLEKGRAEEKRNLARKMLDEGLSLDTISAITGLSPEAVRGDSYEL